MIHLALREMVSESHGATAWNDVKKAAGIGPAHMISANVYPDDVTNALVVAAAERTDCTPAALLEDLGYFWIRFTERGAYAQIMRFTGQTLAEFVGNLDRMHHAIQTSMPDARMPSFRLLEHGAGFLTVDYVSSRQGLAPLVIGLFRGLLERFGLTGTVTGSEGPGSCLRLHIVHDGADE